MMSKDNESAPATLADVRAATEELLTRISGPEITGSGLFPYGVTQIALSVRAGGAEVSVQIAGPDHAHSEDEDEMWMEEDMDDLFEDDEEV